MKAVTASWFAQASSVTLELDDGRLQAAVLVKVGKARVYATPDQARAFADGLRLSAERAEIQTSQLRQNPELAALAALPHAGLA